MFKCWHTRCQLPVWVIPLKVGWGRPRFIGLAYVSKASRLTASRDGLPTVSKASRLTRKPGRLAYGK